MPPKRSSRKRTPTEKGRAAIAEKAEAMKSAPVPVSAPAKKPTPVTQSDPVSAPPAPAPAPASVPVQVPSVTQSAPPVSAPPAPAPAPVPVSAPVMKPIPAPAKKPVQVTSVTQSAPPVSAPVPVPVSAPVVKPIPAPAPVPVSAPVVKPIPAPAPVPAPVKKPAQAPPQPSAPASVAEPAPQPSAPAAIKNPYTGKHIPNSFWKIITNNATEEKQLTPADIPYYAVRCQTGQKSAIINDPNSPVRGSFYKVSMADISDSDASRVINEIDNLSSLQLVHTDKQFPGTYFIHTKVNDLYKDKTLFETTYTIPGIYWGAFINRLHIPDTNFLTEQLEYLLYKIEQNYSSDVIHGSTGARTLN